MNKILTTLSGLALILGLGIATAAPAAATGTLVGPYPSQSNCNYNRAFYVNAYGANNVGPCFEYFGSANKGKWGFFIPRR